MSVLESVPAETNKLHATRAARAETTAVQQAVDVGGVEGAGAMIYTFSDGSTRTTEHAFAHLGVQRITRKRVNRTTIVSVTTTEALKAQEAKTVFVPVSLPAPTPPAQAADIRIELRRGPIAVTVSWPASAAS